MDSTTTGSEQSISTKNRNTAGPNLVSRDLEPRDKFEEVLIQEHKKQQDQLQAIIDKIQGKHKA